jgi:hypothetical protein
MKRTFNLVLLLVICCYVLSVDFKGFKIKTFSNSDNMQILDYDEKTFTLKLDGGMLLFEADGEEDSKKPVDEVKFVKTGDFKFLKEDDVDQYSVLGEAHIVNKNDLTPIEGNLKELVTSSKGTCWEEEDKTGSFTNTIKLWLEGKIVRVSVDHDNGTFFVPYNGLWLKTNKLEFTGQSLSFTTANHRKTEIQGAKENYKSNKIKLEAFAERLRSHWEIKETHEDDKYSITIAKKKNRRLRK